MRTPDQPSPDFVARILEAQFPELAPANAVYLGEGCDSVAFEVNGTWVFRFPKKADVAQQLLTEMRVLPVLAERLPVPIPDFRFHGEPTSEFPHHFGGYLKMPGVPAIHLETDRFSLRKIASTLARFLSVLHSFSLRDASRLGVPDQGIEALVEEIRADALRDFELVAQVAPGAPIEAWRAYLDGGPEVEVHPAKSCLVHNDLAAEHVLCDPMTRLVTGVIDWSDVAIGDPAADFAGMLHWGGEGFFNDVLSAYEGHVDPTLPARARFIAACRGVADIRFGLELDRPEYVTAGIRALQQCIQQLSAVHC